MPLSIHMGKGGGKNKAKTVGKSSRENGRSNVGDGRKSPKNRVRVSGPRPKKKNPLLVPIRAEREKRNTSGKPARTLVWSWVQKFKWFDLPPNQKFTPPNECP